MWAQRFAGNPDQEVLHYADFSADELAAQIQLRVMKYHVRIVGMSAWASTSPGGIITHHALVTFEPEPVQERVDFRPMGGPG